MKRKALVSALLALAFVFSSLTGCLTSSPRQTASEAPLAGTEITITDVAGHTVTLPAPAVRVVGTHNPTMNQLVILGGGGKYIAGFGNKSTSGALYEIVYPELTDEVTQIGSGSNINYESALAVGADLVILPERHADLVAEFEKIGIPAAVVLPNGESFDTIRESLRRVAVLVGEDERAEQIISFFDEKVEAVVEAAKQAEYNPLVIFTGGSSPLSVANGSLLQSSLIEMAGGVNVAKDLPGSGDYVNVSIEEIIGWDPEIIYIPAYAKYTVDDILGDPAWSSVKAVQDKRVYMFPSALEPWDYPTPSVALGLSWMLHSMHSGLYTIEQVVRDAAEYYEMVYGRIFAAEELGLN